MAGSSYMPAWVIKFFTIFFAALCFTQVHRSRVLSWKIFLDHLSVQCDNESGVGLAKISVTPSHVSPATAELPTFAQTRGKRNERVACFMYCIIQEIGNRARLCGISRWKLWNVAMPVRCWSSEPTWHVHLARDDWIYEKSVMSSTPDHVTLTERQTSNFCLNL